MRAFRPTYGSKAPRTAMRSAPVGGALAEPLRSQAALMTPGGRA